jgi:sterol 3beta-glucosyltransferase
VKVLILTLGTRGDVQPFVALAQGLTKVGHEAVLAAPHRFARFVGERGVTFAGIDDGPMRLMDRDAESGTVVVDIASGGLAAKLALARRMPAMFTTVLEDCWSVAAEGPGAGADVLVHNGQVIAGQHVAERLGIPAVLALAIPVYVPTREFSWPGVAAPAWLPRALNRATYLGMRGPAVLFGRTVDRWRGTTLGLPRRRGRHDPCLRPDGSPAPVLHAISRHVVPRPADWPPSATVTGYWFAPERPRLPDALTRFLDAGDPPLFVGFGSMAGPDPAGTAAIVLDAARRAGVRAVLGIGWGGLAATASDDVFVTDEVPHEHLFPRVAAVVHHGGAGTVAAAAAAGRPQIVCPFVADQPFWGRRLHDLGVATEPIRQRHLSADRLATAIREATTAPGLAAAAADLGTRVRAERGVDNAVGQLERIVEAHLAGR